MNRNKRMIKNVFVYLLGNFGSKILTFLLLPLYTSHLNVEEYGLINLITNIVPLIGPIFTLQITECIFRFLCNEQDVMKQKKSITNSFIIFLLGISSFIIIYIPFCIITKFQYSILFIVYFIFNYLALYVQQILRGLNKNTDYAITGVLSTLINLLINILLIVQLKERSLLLATFFASFIVTIYGMIKCKFIKLVDFKLFSVKEIKEQISYSIPLIPNQICWWFNGISGLYLVKYFLGDNATGLISFANKFPSLIATINNIYFLAWTESAIYEFNSKDRDQYFSNNFKMFAILQLILFSVLIIVVKIYSLLTISPEYLSALKLIPLMFVSMIFNALASFLGTAYTASMKTKEAFKTTIVAAIFNLLFSIILIPIVGISGFAVSNIISYLIFFIIRIKSVNKIIKLTINDKKDYLYQLILSIFSILVFYLFDLKINFLYLVILLLTIMLTYKNIIKNILSKVKIIVKVKK